MLLMLVELVFFPEKMNYEINRNKFFLMGDDEMMNDEYVGHFFLISLEK